MADAKTSHLYFNVSISNPSTATGSVPCVMNQTMSTGPILDKANKFKGSIVRFTLPLSSLPYFQCAPSTTPTKTGWHIGDNIVGGQAITTINIFGGSSFNLGVGTQLYLQSQSTGSVYGPITLTAVAGGGASQLQISSWTPPGSGTLIAAGGGDVVLLTTPYRLTLRYNSIDYTSWVNLIQLDNTFNVYYVSQWIDSVNVALQVANTAVVAANSSITQLQTPPRLSFDPVTNLITLNTPFLTWENTAPNSPAIYMNSPLSALFSQIPQTFVATNSSSGKDSQFRILSRAPWTATLTTNIPNMRSNPVVVSINTLGTTSAGITAGTLTSNIAVNAPGLTARVGPGQAVVIFSGSNSQEQMTGTDSLAFNGGGVTTLCVLPFTPTFTYPIGSTVGVSDWVLVWFAVPRPIPAGSTLALATSTGQFQLVTTTVNASPGDSWVVVQPFVPFAAFNASSATVTPVASTGLISTTDEAPSAVCWWTTTSIVVTSNSLPIRQEILPTSTAGEFVSIPIVSDFVVTPQDRLSANTSLVYLPSAQYRWFDLIGASEVRQFDLNFFAADATGLRENWKPISVAPGQAGSAKVLFQHKLIGDKRCLVEQEEELEKGGGFLPMKKRARHDFE